jgi:hypothetical protein
LTALSTERVLDRIWGGALDMLEGSFGIGVSLPSRRESAPYAPQSV